ncbi:hypothetical protein FSARC_11756 [Fusarium sarcochroum]|uniref:Uncharacterized protein n=1 Tax=Fusarium sarcochroum TaxID=1208366 RepID=A0A8H4WYS3_9HYPO|nr:hypothetical protein FSARC_11756 [Fusarium sarcochroum]
MSHKSFSGGSSVYSDDLSTTSSTWTTTYKRLPKKQPMAIRFLSWVAGAPPGATAVKKRTRDIRDDQSVRSGGSSFSYWNEPETQLYWVAYPHSQYYGSSSGSNSSSSGRSNRSGRSRKHGGGSRKHFDGAVPRPPMMSPHPGPMNGPFGGMPPPPPPMGPPMMDGGFEGGFDGGFDGSQDGSYDDEYDGVYDQGYDAGFGGGYSPAPHMGGVPPMPPPPMNPPMSDAAPFINVTGQNQPGNPFH